MRHFRRALQERRQRRAWRGYLADLEPWLSHAAHHVVVRALVEAQTARSGRAFVGVQDVIDEARGAAKHVEQRAGHGSETVAWVAAATLRRSLERARGPLPLDTDAYDPAFAWAPSPSEPE
ncbi:hypothetical protein [Streptomyces sp. NPDC059009]|uniref:hypothetical protein n=1 Tax=Streptomyces sp. NPDC059009 TaxID=3346694 RepID=UPI0036B25A29